MGGKPRAGHDVILIPRHTAHGQIAFNPAAIIQHLRIDQRAHGPVHIIGRNPVECGRRIRAFEGEFG